MFRTRRDVEEHVANILSKIDNENEKLLKGYTFARLFFQVKDYESSKKYLTGYLSVRQQYAPAHKLMAQIYEATNSLENALQSYKRSLEIDSNQKDIILKICELYCQLPVDPETARYWAERAEQLFPYHDTVFKLREYLVSAEGEPDHQELENLIASDLAAQPKNVDRRIKLLRLYLDTERVTEAYDHATMIESKRLFPYSMDWYYLLCDIFEAYQEEDGKELNSQFYINYLTALDHLIFLTLAEPHAFILESRKKSCSINDAAAVLLIFDQVLKKAYQMNINEGSWTYFINHMKGQLYFHMTSLIMKRIKMDQGNPKEAFRFSAGLALVCYTFKPVNLLHEVWFSQMEDNQKTFTNFFQQGCLRISFIGHMLLSLCKDDKSNWLQRMKTEVCIPQVKERIYNRIFSSLFQKEKLQLSYFISDTTFEQTSLELPSDVALKEYDKFAYKLCPDSLHHLVWLELHRENAKISSFDIISEIFKNLQYSHKNLSKGSCESMCVLDLEAYLCAAVYQSKLMIEIKSNINSRNDSVLSYPPDIIDALCTAIQASWWKAAYGLYTASIKEKLGEYRHNLQQGLEVIRGVGCHGMEVQLVIHLARTFASKADTLDKVSENKTDRNKNKLTSENVTALYFRATHYWNIALGMLDKLMSGKSLNMPKNPMFIHSKKPLSKNDIKAHKEEGELFLAVRLMESDKLNEAAERLSKLSSPYGSYYLALTLKKLASQEQKFSSTRSALLNKAKTSLHETLDRIKDDNTHPLNKEIFIELEDVENDLAFELSVAGENSCDDPDEVDAYDEPSFQSFSYNNSATHSTPRPSSKFMSSKHTMKSINQLSPTKHYEPSPERLDAQIRALALNQDTLVKSFLQQQQTLLETNNSIVEALKQNKDVLEQLKKQLEDLSLSEMKFHQKTVPKKSIYTKTNLERRNEEEDYYDPNGILDYYEEGAPGDEFRHPGYTFDHSSRLTHEPTRGASAALNYVVPPTLPPPGPPPPLNHYNYQYPHAMLPTPPAAVPERSPYYHPPPGQGLPFNEGQQLPQFHFHVASAIGKPPPPLSTSLPQVVPGLPPPSASVPPLSVPQVVSGLPVPPISVPPMSVSVPPPAAAPLPVSNPWSKPNSVPHAFQIPLPTSSVIAQGVNSLTAVVTQATSPAALSTVTTSHSQLKDLLQTPPLTRTITFGQPVSTTQPSTASITAPSIFSGLNKTPETSNEHIRYDSETATSPDIDGHDLEREVMGDFKPLIPLPAEIVVETGEENEVVLFENRAKLYRFIDQEWKERGTGVIKILHHEGSGRVRLLMRRDQVLKVCANHYITPNMEIYQMKNSDKAWTWVAQDFADEELRPEHFCIRFKSPEIANDFKAAFEKAVRISKETEVKKITSPKASAAITSPLSSKPFGSKFLPKQGSWTCPTCYVSNSGDKLLCVACETKKPGSQISTTTTGSTVITAPVTSGFGSKFLPKPGSWTCSSCYVSNPSDKMICSACETKKPGSQTLVTSSVTPAVATVLSTGSDFGAKFLPKAGSWTCSTCLVNNTADKTSCVACETKKPGVSATTAVLTSSTSLSTISPEFTSKPFLNSAVSSNFTFGGQTNVFTSVSSTLDNTSKSVFGGFTFSSNPVIQEAETPEMKDREILVVSTKSKNGPQVTKVNTPKTSPFSGFSFKASTVTTVTSSTQPPFSGFSFKTSVASSTSSSSQTATNVTTNNSSISLSSIQNSMQNVSPAFVFPKSSSEKGISTATETKNTSDSTGSGSVFPNFTSDNLKSGNDFVFGVKPSTQPTTFTFGLSTLTSKSNETIGFKPTFSAASNAPAMFGGAIQTAESPQIVTVTGGTTQKTDSSQLSTIFGGTSKTDLPQNASIFGGIAQVSESKLPVSSFFGSTSDKTEVTTPVFSKSSSFETTQEKSLFGGLNDKLEHPKSIPFGTALKSETTSVSTPSVFNFGSAEESKNESVPIEFRFGSPQKYEFNFSGVRPKSPTKNPKSPVTPSDVEDDEENESFDADNIYFQPVIPLPPKVDVKTGEENEKTLFCKRAKLFRFCSGEWKERGIGDIKILHDEVGKKVRLLMRRDQVLKVCLNHYITKDIKFEKRGDKTLSWAATDFSENEPSPELFALRFKTAEFADEFLDEVNNALNCTEKQSSVQDVEKAAASFSFKDENAPKSESFENIPKSESLFTPGSLASRFGSSAASSLGSIPSSQPSFGDFSFKDSPATNGFFKFSSTTDNQKSSDNKEFIFGKGSDEKKTDVDDEVQIIFEAVPSPEDAALAEELQLTPTFFLYKEKPPCPGCIGCEDFLSPPKSTSTKMIGNDSGNNAIESDVATQDTTQEESGSTMFNTSSSLSFADLASKTGFGTITSPTQKKIFEGAGTPLFANLNCSAEDEEAVAQGPDIHFEPVIPLPELITVTTGEEEETPIFVSRAKLFRFDPAKKEWKERGVGDFKILKHNEKLRFRIILRREQVHKIACNHCITANMELSPLATSNNALCWNALDYSESQPEASQFAVRFKTKDILEQFREKFNECVSILKEDSTKPIGVQNTTESAVKIESSVQESPAAENVVDTSNEHETSTSETNDEDEDEESEDDSTLFEKRVSFEISDGNDNEFKSVGMGLLRIAYDDEVFGYHVYMTSDDGQVLCEHIIAIQTALRTEKKKASWSAIDLTLDPPIRRRFRATFSSIDALKEFSSIFEEGKEAAVHSEIVERTDCFNSSGHQT